MVGAHDADIRAVGTGGKQRDAADDGLPAHLGDQDHRYGGADDCRGCRHTVPGVLAGFLSALGMWINTPLYWLGVWIVYGLFVFGLARLMGRGNTLQAFYAATAFIAVPLLLTGLSPIPVLGPLLVLAALVLAFAVYFKAAWFVTKLDGGRTFLCMLLLLAVGVVLPLIALLAGLVVSLFPLGQPM